MQFTEVIGQQSIIDQLVSLVNNGHMPHALMLAGPHGNGKLAIALALASYMLGERYADHSILTDPAKIQNAEAMLRSWQHPDLHFTFPVFKPKGSSAGYKPVSDDFLPRWREILAKGAYFSIEQWMEYIDVENQQLQIYEAESDALLHKLSLKSSMGGYKVSIIWMPERMNETCANKLLKLLEEPPQLTVFILVCEEPQRLLATIRSRVQRIDIPRIATDTIHQALIERRGIEPDMARIIAHNAEGSWLTALQTLDVSNETLQFLDLYKMMMRRAYMRSVRELKEWAESVAAFGREKQKRFLVYMLRMTRENFVYNFRQPELNYMTSEENDFSTKFAQFVNERNVIEMTETIQYAIRAISQNANSKMVLFNMTLKMIILLRR